MEFEKFEVGEKIMKPGPEGAFLGVENSGLTLKMCFNRPKEKEIEAVKSGETKFRLAHVDNILFILAKFGGMNWIEFPYNRGMSDGLFLDRPESEEGYGALVMLIDSSTGILKAMRYYGLSTPYSIAFSDELIKQEPIMDKKDYTSCVRNVQYRYTTDDLVGMSISQCKFDRK